MSKPNPIRTAVVVPFLIGCFWVSPVRADVSHARIVRLSIVQGDVRFAEDVKGDSLTASGAGWQTAVMNLPIRQGYVLATDKGRAAVEFENGAMAFLAENTVLEFYDLSLEDGARTTRLILRQGSAEFTVNPERGEYFSVTGGDFSVQAEGRTTFRVNNFDDGSNVQVFQGRISVLSKDKQTPLTRGQSLSMRAGDPRSESVGNAAAPDDFDQWVGGRVQAAETATSAALQSPNYGGYVSGFGDLYTYGSWFGVGGYGSCWMPYGVGFGWSPFNSGSWYFDPTLGWTFVGSQPWGWLPYHYGGWISAPGYGWCWSPGPYIGNYAGYGWGYRNHRRWRAATAVWVRSTGLTGLVLSNPMDKNGKKPINLSQGVFPVNARSVSDRMVAETGANWKIEKRPAQNLLQSSLQPAAQPAPLAISMFDGGGGEAESARTSAGSESRILYDPASHRFINSNVIARHGDVAGANGRDYPATARGQLERGTAEMGRDSFRSAQMPVRASAPPRPSFAPPPVPRSTVMERPNSGWGGSRWGGGSSGDASGGSFSRGSAPAASSPAPRASAPAPSAGRPH
ncbi:MAG TPA: FecR family protein [Terriglobales bacterium]|nr:FecR family protein [Terriglobales bacterium]